MRIVRTIIRFRVSLLATQWTAIFGDSDAFSLVTSCRRCWTSISFHSFVSKIIASYDCRWLDLGLLIVVLWHTITICWDLTTLCPKCSFVWQPCSLVTECLEGLITPSIHAEGARSIVLIGQDLSHHLIDQNTIKLQVEQLNFFLDALEAVWTVFVKHAQVWDAFGHVHRVFATWKALASDE